MTTLSIRATDVGEFIRYKSCQRRFKLGFNNRELAKQLPFAGKLFATLDPVLKAEGRKREAEWEQYLNKLRFVDLLRYEGRPSEVKSASWTQFQALAGRIKKGENVFIRELAVQAELGAFQVTGCIDFVLITWQKGKPLLRLVECKASRKDQTYHRAQLAIYKIIVEQMLSDEAGVLSAADMALAAQDIECVVARIDEGTNRGQAIMDIAAFDLSMIEADVRRLLASEGPLRRILESPLEDLNYQIESKCDDCMFNIHCLPESGRLRKLELLGCDSSTVRALQAGGIKTLDELAHVDLSSKQAEQVTASNNLSSTLQFLKAKAFARLSTLPDPPPDCYPVQFLSYRIFSQLPEYDILGHRLVRVYLCVDYDYAENRIGSLSAHITASDGMLYTGWQQIEGKNVADPELKERIRLKAGDGEKAQYEERALQGVDLIQTRETAWTGFYEWDNEAERQMLECFFEGVVNAIKEAAGARNHAPVHFYFWSRMEIAKLVEACSRASSDLLGHLQQLLGCRESLEQLIYSCVQDEVNNRYGLGWTGRGLLVATSLSWYGWTYHWHRKVDGVSTWIDREFSQDLFDFKAELNFENGEWQKIEKKDSSRHRFEIRSQFNDTLPAGYLHAYWGVLPEPDESLRDNARKAIENFRQAARPGLLKEYLRARVHALRWIEERIELKSSALQKPPVILSDLPQFTLKVNHPAAAAIDFLRLDFHIKFTDWLAAHLVSPKERVIFGRTIPVANVVCKNDRLYAKINLTNYGFSQEDLQIRCCFEEKAFVRLSPCQEDPGVSQTLVQFGRAGITCVIEKLDWQSGQIEMSTIPLRDADRYRLSSRKIESDSLIYAFATLDESPSDFVSVRVEKRLESKLGRHAYAWFDRTSPKIPAAAALSDLQMHPLRKLVRSFKAGTDSSSLAPDQIKAVLNGLNTTVQLLQGPPGTGKTMSTAVAILIRIMARLNKRSTVFVSANTHTAIDTLLERLLTVAESLKAQTLEQAIELPPLAIFKAESAPGATLVPGMVKVKADESGLQKIKLARQSAVAIVGGTAGTLLKLADLDKDLGADMLVIDEASMMVFPHFLALATLVKESGTFMLAGDHRQLSPILAHDWEHEDRPPTVLYQPYASAYDAIRDLGGSLNENQISMSSLQYTFRLPADIRKLIARLYKLDEVDLHGPPESNGPEGVRITRHLDPEPGQSAPAAPWRRVWQGKTGMYLVAHTERESRQSNLLEVQIIENILESGTGNQANSIAIVTPHRAQRALLQKQLSRFSESVDLIDTVERLQGGERPCVIFSATVSDPAAIASSVEFILDLNRSNVAFSRAKQRLIVVCSEELINFIPASLAQYEEAFLWKSLKEVCSKQVEKLQINGHEIGIFSPA